MTKKELEKKLDNIEQRIPKHVVIDQKLETTKTIHFIDDYSDVLIAELERRAGRGHISEEKPKYCRKDSCEIKERVGEYNIINWHGYTDTERTDFAGIINKCGMCQDSFLRGQ